MKFLTFVDMHNDPKSLSHLISIAKKDDIDFVVCCGDISDFGQGLKKALDKFDKLGKKFYLIPGNHEEGEGVLDSFLKGYKNCFNNSGL